MKQFSLQWSFQSSFPHHCWLGLLVCYWLLLSPSTNSTWRSHWLLHKGWELNPQSNYFIIFTGSAQHLEIFWLTPWLVLSFIIFSLTSFTCIQTFCKALTFLFLLPLGSLPFVKATWTLPLQTLTFFHFQLLIRKFYLVTDFSCKLSMDQNYLARSKVYISFFIVLKEKPSTYLFCNFFKVSAC